MLVDGLQCLLTAVQLLLLLQLLTPSLCLGLKVLIRSVQLLLVLHELLLFATELGDELQAHLSQLLQLLGAHHCSLTQHQHNTFHYSLTQHQNNTGA